MIRSTLARHGHSICRTCQPGRSVFGSANDYWKSLKKRGNYNVVKPGMVSDQITFPDGIQLPSYALTGLVDPAPEEVDIKTPDQIERLRQSCALASKILREIGTRLEVGMTTDEIDTLVNQICLESQAYPSPLNYRGFPKSVCTSVNNVACHGIPDDRPLQDGDIMTVDVSVYLNGYHGDCACSFAIGNVDDKGHHLLKVTKECLDRAIEICKPKQRLSFIGETIERIANAAGLQVVPCFCGHGIGTYFHGPPDILHFDTGTLTPGIIKEGMTFTIEPVLSEGQSEIVILEDGWTAVTIDHSRTAQYEHTVLITSKGAEILTL